MREKILILIVNFCTRYCIKYNEIDMFHSDVQKHLSYTGSHKRFLVWAMLENGWMCILNYVSWLVSVILHFNALCDEYTVQKQLYNVAQK